MITKMLKSDSYLLLATDEFLTKLSQNKRAMSSVPKLQQTLEENHTELLQAVVFVIKAFANQGEGGSSDVEYI